MNAKQIEYLKLTLSKKIGSVDINLSRTINFQVKIVAFSINSTAFDFECKELEKKCFYQIYSNFAD